MHAARAALACALLLVGCATAPVPTPTSNGGATPGPAPTGSPAVPLAEPGRPFDAQALLDAMGESRRPGGVPEALQDETVAARIADLVWTRDGRPWEHVTVDGSCGTDRCLLELAGGGPGGVGDDVWVFSVMPGTGAVELVSADLHAVPAEAVDALDAMARGAEGGALEGLVLASARWLPPPDDGRYLLAYRAGDEEGSCRRDVAVDAASGEVELEEEVDC